MSDYKELFAQAEVKLSAIGEITDQEEVNRLVGEAETLIEQAETKKKAAELKARMAEPVMPAPLPMDSGNSTTPAPPEPNIEDTREAARKAVYLTKFGEPDGAIKTVLRDLHGADYDQKRYEQAQGFIKYLRTGRGESREHLWTPGDVQAAIKAGQDVWEMKTTMVEATDTLGGYAVPADFRADVVSRMAGLTVVRSNGARVISTSRDRLEMPSRTGGGDQYQGAVRMNWVEETPASSSTSAENATLGLETIPVHTCMANTDLSRNLVEDAAFNIVEFLTEEFASALAIDEDNQFLTGDGAGKPEGILRDSGLGAIGSSNYAFSGTAGTVTWDGLVKLVWGLAAQYRQRGVIIGARATYEDVALLQDGNGQPYWRERYGDNVSAGGGGTIQRLLGYPALEQEAMPAVASNAYSMVFGDLSGYVIADRTGVSIERYIDSERAVVNQVRYVLRRRLGGGVVEPWKFIALKLSAS